MSADAIDFDPCDPLLRSIGVEPDYNIECFCKAFPGLMRQSVNQIEVDRLECMVTRLVDYRCGIAHALFAVDRYLYLLVKILYPDADAIETDATQ